MRKKIIDFLKLHPIAVRIFWSIARCFLLFLGLFIPVNKKSMIFCSFGGRKFNDSPKAIYDEVCNRKEFEDWKLIWAFDNPDNFSIPRGDKVKIDTISFFITLLGSYVWVGNTGIDRGIELHRKKNIVVETWHGTPIKKIGGDEHTNALGGGMVAKKGTPDNLTIRCAQSEYDRQIFHRIFNADVEAILLCDLPRNDKLLKYKKEDIQKIKKELVLDENKKIILYAPTYREYQIDDGDNTYLAPPIDLNKWEKKLGNKYMLLIRAHYAVSAALKFQENDFIKDVSNYQDIGDLYAISDILISDYSSTYFDYSLLERPMFCFAYDLEEYEEKRGLYFNLQDELPCQIDKNEDDLIRHIIELNEKKAVENVISFRHKFAPYAGKASKTVVDEILNRVDERNIK